MSVAAPGACVALELQPLQRARHRPADGECRRSKKQQPRHQAHECFLRRVQQHHRSGGAAQQPCQTHQQGRAQILAHILAVRGHRGKLAGPDGHSVRGVGLNGEYLHAQQRRKRQKRPAASHGVQHASQKCGHHEPHPVPVDGCQCAGKLRHEIFIVECPGSSPACR